MTPRIAAIICTYQRYHILEGAVQSLLAQSLKAGELEIIVVDNSPDQAAAAAFGARYEGVPHLRYVLEPAAGLSHARNTGMKLAQADIAGFIDDDAVAEPGWAAAILAGFAAFAPKAGAVGGMVQPLWQSQPPDWLAEELWAYLSVLDRGGPMREIFHKDAIFGCNMALDRQLALGLGGFDIKLGRMGASTALISNEESGLFLKMHAAGRSTVYTPDAVVGHKIDPGRFTQNWFRRRAAWQAVSDFIMDPKEAAGVAEEAALHLSHLESSGKRQRFLSFFEPVADKKDFAGEVALIRKLTMVALNGGAKMLEKQGLPLAPAARKIFQNTDFERKYAPHLRLLWRRVQALIGVRS